MLVWPGWPQRWRWFPATAAARVWWCFRGCRDGLCSLWDVGPSSLPLWGHAWGTGLWPGQRTSSPSTPSITLSPSVMIEATDCGLTASAVLTGAVLGSDCSGPVRSLLTLVNTMWLSWITPPQTISSHYSWLYSLLPDQSVAARSSDIIRLLYNCQLPCSFPDLLHCLPILQPCPSLAHLLARLLSPSVVINSMILYSEEPVRMRWMKEADGIPWCDHDKSKTNWISCWAFAKENTLPKALLCPVEYHARTLRIGSESQLDLQPSTREHTPIYQTIRTQEQTRNRVTYFGDTISGGCHKPQPSFPTFFCAGGTELKLTAISDTCAGCWACWVIDVGRFASELTTLTKPMSVDSIIKQLSYLSIASSKRLTFPSKSPASTLQSCMRCSRRETNPTSPNFPRTTRGFISLILCRRSTLSFWSHTSQISMSFGISFVNSLGEEL